MFSASQSLGKDGCGGGQPELFISVCWSKCVEWNLETAVLWRSGFCSERSEHTLNSTVRTGQALIGLAAALEMGS